MTTILVGTDSSAAADLAVDHAARLARDRESDLVVLLVRPDGDLRSVVDPGKAADPDRYLAHVAERLIQDFLRQVRPLLQQRDKREKSVALQAVLVKPSGVAVRASSSSRKTGSTRRSARGTRSRCTNSMREWRCRNISTKRKPSMP